MFINQFGRQLVEEVLSLVADLAVNSRQLGIWLWPCGDVILAAGYGPLHRLSLRCPVRKKRGLGTGLGTGDRGEDLEPKVDAGHLAVSGMGNAVSGMLNSTTNVTYQWPQASLPEHGTVGGSSTGWL